MKPLSAHPPEAENPILRHDQKGICTLTLNRPQSYNALSLHCMATLLNALAKIAQDPAIKVVIVAGAGRGFCAGHDLTELRAHPSHEFYRLTFQTCSKLMLALTELPQPVIAQVHGIATAAGCQLVATCDLAVADEGARFSTPGVNIGLFCSTPMVALSRAVSRKHALEMLLLGEMVPAAQAQQIGLINRVVPPNQLQQATQDMAETIARKSPLALKIGKKAFYRQIDQDLPAAYDYCSHVMAENMRAADAKEGIAAFIEKRPPAWKGT